MKPLNGGLGPTPEDLWGDSTLRRYYASQARREARRAERGHGAVYRHATPEERLATASYLRQVAGLHAAAARIVETA